MGRKFPRKARRDFCAFTFFMQLVLCIVLTLTSLVGILGLYNFWFWLIMAVFLLFGWQMGKDASDTLKAMGESRNLSDVEALWKMEYESVGMKG